MAVVVAAGALVAVVGGVAGQFLRHPFRLFLIDMESSQSLVVVVVAICREVVVSS